MKVNASLTVANVTRIKSRIMINVGVSAKIRKNIMHVKKDHICNSASYNCKNVEYLASTIEDSLITCVIKLETMQVVYQEIYQQMLWGLCQQVLRVQRQQISITKK